MRWHAWAFLTIALLPAPLWAQSAAGGAGITLPGSSGQTCVQIAVPGEKPSAYNCLNQELQQQVENAKPAAPDLPLTATSPSNRAGTFNEQGISEQYGKNFGKSVIPYRPQPPVFNNSLGPAR